jgi:hypothetical protein
MRCPPAITPPRRGPRRSPVATCLGACAAAVLLFSSPLAFPLARAADRAPQLAVPPPPMAAHRALYTLTLDNRATAGGATSDVIGASGTMGYEVLDACDGWATHQQLDMVVTNADGQNVHMISDYTTWESKDGLSFRFHTRQTTDDDVTSQEDGDAKLNGPGGAGVAHYSNPKEMTKALPVGTLFPMAHTEALLAAARAGKKFITLPLFDGTSDNGAEDSSIVVIDTRPPTASAYPILSTLASARVHLAFFERTPNAITPDYEVTMRYWDNGVADDLVMNFGDFVMDAKLKDLKPQPHRC